LRLGQEQWKDGPDKSTCVWYKLLPWHSPQTATSLAPNKGHLPGFISPLAALAEAASGAKARTDSVLKGCMDTYKAGT
jgi:hypothetical protein